MAPKCVDTTIILFDIGRNVSTPDATNGRSFFDNARECIIRIVERKILSRPNDLINVILFGSNKTCNNLAKQSPGLFTNIHVLNELEQPSWKLLRSLPDKPTKLSGDWFEALIVAADYFKNCLCGVKVANYKIVLMTNFQSPANFGNNVEQVVEGFQKENFEVTVIGPNIYDENLKGDDVDLARSFVDVTNGDAATFDDAMGYLLYHRKKSTHANPWNVDLSIGPNIKIPVSVYGRIRDDAVIKTWQTTVKDPITKKSSMEQSVIKKREYINNENQTTFNIEDTVEAYKYGQKAIPFSENDKSMLYKSGNKCLSIYGFTKANNVKWHNLCGNGVSYLFGKKGDKKACYTIQCLIDCMSETNVVAIARRVYNNENAPQMHVISPVIDSDNYFCLSVIAINYKEDIKNMAFPSTDLPKYSYTTEQVDAFKDLIKSMDLTRAYDHSYDDSEAFPTAETVNPSIQYILDCIAFRAMHPNEPLPPPRDDIMVLFKVPAPIEKRSRDSIDKLSKMFNIQKIDTSSKKPTTKVAANHNAVNGKQKNNSNNNSIDLDIPKLTLIHAKDEVMNIGTVNPIEDYKILLSKGKSLPELCTEMSDVIETMIYLNFNNDYTKAIGALQFFREQCVKDDPSYYNNWFMQFKKDLLERKSDDVVELLKENKLRLITNEENASSNIDAQESDDDIYENDTLPNSTELTIPTDINDFFDDMF